MDVLKEYYSARAPEYEEIYRRGDNVRRAELEKIADIIRVIMIGRRVLEIACGTGYWTKITAETAAFIIATDISEQMIAQAERKKLPTGKVQFQLCDAYDLSPITGQFNAGMANFYLSHVPKNRLASFLTGFHQRLGDGAVVFMTDNVYIPEVGGQLIRLPDSDDTYRQRGLSDGSMYNVLKNYYTKEELFSIFEPFSRNLQITFGECFWWLTYRVKSHPERSEGSL